MALFSMYRVLSSCFRYSRRGLSCLPHVSSQEACIFGLNPKVHGKLLGSRLRGYNGLQFQNVRLVQTGQYSDKKNNSSDEELFNEEFKTVVSFLTSQLKDLKLQEVVSRYEQMLVYNVLHGKKIRGLGVIKTYKHLVPRASQDDKRQAFLLGWLIELLQAFFLVMDDIMDQSTTRRGMPCWYRQEEVGLTAINDAILLECAIYQLLKAYFSQHPNYIDMVDLFHEVTHYTSTGQCLDMFTTPDGAKVNIDMLTLERYTAIITFKTAYYTFCLPVRLALLLAGQGDSYTNEVERLLLDVGKFFQVQDDFLDCFGDPAVIGKKGTDIISGKCAWPIVMALQRVGQDDKYILQENYGNNNLESVEKVKLIFKKVNIPGIYEEFENESYSSICKQIESVTKSSNIPEGVFSGLLNQVYKRSK